MFLRARPASRRSRFGADPLTQGYAPLDRTTSLALGGAIADL
jgi:hypothetical protein